MYIYFCKSLCVCVYEYIHIDTRKSLQPIYIYIYIHTYIHMYVCMYVYIYQRTHIDTRTHTNRHQEKLATQKHDKTKEYIMYLTHICMPGAHCQ